MSRHAEIIGEAQDMDGRRWDVHERRPTAHGFDILLGWPQGEPRGRGCRGIGVILTPALARYLTAPRGPGDKIDLPIGTTAVKRLRRILQTAWTATLAAWWAAREDDLRTLTLDDFCRAHGCSHGAASTHRAAIKVRGKIK